MRKNMGLITICGWLVAGVAVATDGREKVSSSAGTVKSRVSNVISRFEAKGNETLSGFYARLSNCVGPVDAPTVVGLRVNGALRQECVTIPVYGTPLNEYTRQNGRIFPPLDVAQEYRIALAEPLALKAGDKLNLEIISSGAMTGGVTAGLQFEGAWNLADMREPFRQTKAAGPVSRIAWSDREVVGYRHGKEVRSDVRRTKQFHRRRRSRRHALAVHRVLFRGRAIWRGQGRVVCAYFRIQEAAWQTVGAGRARRRLSSPNHLRGRSVRLSGHGRYALSGLWGR